MTRIVVAASMIAALALTPAVHAGDRAPLKRDRQTYLGLYFAVKERFGLRAPGRQILRQGIRTPHGRVLEAKARHVGKSIRTFRRWLAPPIARVAVNDRPPITTTSARPVRAGGRWAIPARIVMCESRGNYQARNPQSGAYGAYQVLPSTAAAYGCDLSTPAGQDVCAARIWARQGPSAWVCAG